MPPSLDASAVRAWCRLSLRALGRAREEIDAINVYPVADGDTGTNLYLTMESAAQSVDAAFDGHAATSDADGTRPTLAEAFLAMSHGALIGARGNSGTILAQLLRGMNESIAAPAVTLGGFAGTGEARAGGAGGGVAGPGVPDAEHAAAAVVRQALRTAAASGYEAVSRPVEGTMLTVATGAADAAQTADGGLAEVVRAAHAGALAALAGTPGQLGVLRRAGVVDAGGLGLVAVLGALCEAVTGEAPLTPLPGAVTGAGTSFRHAHPVAGSATTHTARPGGAGPAAAPEPDSDPGTEPIPVPEPGPGAALTPGPGAVLDPDLGPAPAPGEDACEQDGHTGEDGPAFEVIFLLEAAGDAPVARLRTRLDALGDSLVVVGGDGLWHVHVHVDDVGAAIEAAIEAGRPYRIRVTHFGAQHRAPDRERVLRGVVAVVQGDGLAGLYAEAGATVVAVRPGEPPASGEIAAAVRRAHAHEVILLPNDTELRDAAGAAAEQARTDGVRVALIPTRSAVQGLAALAVHEPSRRFDEDVVAMTSAAGATRYAELAVAEHRSWTMAGVCQAGDVLGLIDGDVAVIGGDLAETAVVVLDRMLAAGGELVTLVLGEGAPSGLGERIEAHVREVHLAVDTMTYQGGQSAAPLLIGVE
ncbi:DAK2 domain-containing protein [Actinacidiphila acidipaludis]|uniref:DAK2 domain-containing protein n=1 Tax=Actinacidiphila acidipaludis TaxID=2873382 RepID=A0ABS7QHJ0_9ACTN|nr:DAK2 domain-containing protein [Streptomyces acidipaludis]MBY8881880.1 DAK2 domain-containing protein [Streptomyces acidipaludis]